MLIFFSALIICQLFRLSKLLKFTVNKIPYYVDQKTFRIFFPKTIDLLRDNRNSSTVYLSFLKIINFKILKTSIIWVVFIIVEISLRVWYLSNKVKDI